MTVKVRALIKVAGVREPPTPPPPPEKVPFEIVNNSTSYGIQGGNNFFVTLVNQANGYRWDTTDADLIVFVVNSSAPITGFAFYVNSAFVTDQMTRVPFDNYLNSIYYFRPVVTGINSQLQLAAANGLISVGAVAVKNWSGRAPVIFQTVLPFGSTSDPQVVGLSQPLESGEDDLVVFGTGFNLAAQIGTPAGYRTARAPFNVNYWGLSLAIKERSGPIENPQFTYIPTALPSSAVYTASGVIFEPREE